MKVTVVVNDSTGVKLLGISSMIPYCVFLVFFPFVKSIFTIFKSLIFYNGTIIYKVLLYISNISFLQFYEQ